MELLANGTPITVQQWRYQAWLGLQNYEDLLCNSCGSRESQALPIEWIQLKEPVNVRCTLCLGRKWTPPLSFVPKMPKWRKQKYDYLH
jgi:hypothetical protein